MAARRSDQRPTRSARSTTSDAGEAARSSRAKIGVFADLFRKRAEVKRQAELLARGRGAAAAPGRAARCARAKDGSGSCARRRRSAIFQLDAAGHCVYVSPVWQATTGQPAEAAAGLGWAEAFGPGPRHETLASWQGRDRRGPRLGARGSRHQRDRWRDAVAVTCKSSPILGGSGDARWATSALSRTSPRASSPKSG